MKLAPPNNTDLPQLNGFAARSFWLQLLTVVAMVLNSQGIDLFASLCALEIGCTPDAVLATGDRIVSLWQQALPIVTGLWAYLERRAPHYRLVWPWKTGTLGGFLLILLLLAFPPGAALAAGPQCADTATVKDLLASKYGEVAVGGYRGQPGLQRDLQKPGDGNVDNHRVEPGRYELPCGQRAELDGRARAATRGEG